MNANCLLFSKTAHRYMVVANSIAPKETQEVLVVPMQAPKSLERGLGHPNRSRAVQPSIDDKAIHQCHVPLMSVVEPVVNLRRLGALFCTVPRSEAWALDTSSPSHFHRSMVNDIMFINKWAPFGETNVNGCSTLVTRDAVDVWIKQRLVSSYGH